MKSVALALVGLVLAAPAMANPHRFDLAVTVDDLPEHGSLPVGDTRLNIMQTYLAALKAHKVPKVYGFVNAKNVGVTPGLDSALDLWRAAGYPLGNHTLTHVNIKTVGLAAFKADLEAGEPAIRDRMAGEDWKVLRFPFLSIDTTPAAHGDIMAYLKTRGYRIADVSISFNDWAYTEPYARCVAKGDTVAIEAMKVKYMRGVTASIAHATAASQAVYGRQIPQVLLIHEGAFTALMLPQVLDAFEAAGARYVTLDKAQSDKAYAETDPHAGDGLVIERTAFEKGVDLSHIPTDEPINDLDAVCK